MALSEICKGIGRFIRYSAKISRGLRPLDPPWGFGAARRTARIGASRLLINSEHRHLVPGELAPALVVLRGTKLILHCHEAKRYQNANGHFEGPIDFFYLTF